jgi:hypothetical protein
MGPRRNTLATGLLEGLAPPPETHNALFDLLTEYKQRQPYNALCDLRPKTEWVNGHYRLVPNGLLGNKYEWVPGYWRREG